MSPGAVALAYLPQADRKTKLRPVLVICELPKHGDFLVCGITSKLWNCVPGFDDVIRLEDDDFRETGLRRAGVIRIGHLMVMAPDELQGVLGQISHGRRARVVGNFLRFLGQSIGLEVS
jgi:hypothetical protein